MKIKTIIQVGKAKLLVINLILLLSFSLFSEDYRNKTKQIIESSNKEFLIENKKINYFIAIDFLDALAKQDRISIYEKFPYLQGGYNGIIDVDFEWYEMVSNFEGLIINISKPEKYQNDSLYSISIGTPLFYDSKFYFSDFLKEKTKISFNTLFYEGQQRQIIQFDYYSEVNNFSKEEKKYTYDVDLVFDGDYVDFYLYGEFIHRFCKINEKTLKQLFSLFQENKVDLTEVTWPKHADGSCDYNTKDLLTNIKLSSIMYNQIDIPIYENPETNSSVTCNLKKDSKVLIQRIGKKEQINELDDNWVEVEIQSESTGVTDEDYVIGKIGWCYGGYLKENKSVINTDSIKKEEITSCNLEEGNTYSSKLPLIIISASLLLIIILIVIISCKKKRK